MTVIYCDACKNEVVGARQGVNYVIIADKDICLSCEEKLRINLRQQTAATRPVIFKNYKETLTKVVGKMCGVK
jgi:hypothetical protein